MDNKTMNEIMKIQIEINNSNAFSFQCVIFFHSIFAFHFSPIHTDYESQFSLNNETSSLFEFIEQKFN